MFAEFIHVDNSSVTYQYFIIEQFQIQMSNYYANSEPINNDFYIQSQNSQSPRFSLAFEIKKPQPSLTGKQIKEQEGYTNSNHSNQVLKSNDILASFGFKNQFHFNGQQKNVSISNLPSQSYNSDLQLTKKLQLHHKILELDNTDITQNARNKNSLVENNQQKKIKDPRRTESFYSFLYKLSGILASHTRIQGHEFLQRVSIVIRQKNENLKYLMAILNKHWRRQLQNSFINLKFNSMQHSEVVPVETQISNSQTKTFRKQFTKIDMLAQCNIDIDFSEGDKEANLRQIYGQDFETLTKTKSDIQYNNQNISNTNNEEERKLKMFHFNNQIKRKNVDIFNNYGFDIMKTQVVQKKQKRNDSGELSIFSKPNKSIKPEESPFKTLEAQNQNINKFAFATLKIQLDQAPLSQSFSQSEQQYNKVIKPLLTQSVDFIKEEFPDLCDVSLDNHEMGSYLQQNVNIRGSYGRQSETRRLSFLNPLIKNVDSLIQNKFVQNRYDNNSVSHSIESMKISEGDSEGQRNLGRKGRNQNLVHVKPVQEYQTQKQLIFGREKTPEKMRTSKKFLDRPKSMTVIKFNNSPGLDPHQNANFLGKQNVNQFQLSHKPHLRTISNLTPTISKNQNFDPRPSRFLNPPKQEDFENKQRAVSGFPTYTYHSSPNIHKNHIKQNPLPTSPAKQPIRVYFTATSPKHHHPTMPKQQQPVSSHQNVNLYGLNSQNDPNNQNIQMKPRVSHHYLPSPSKVYNNYLPTQEKITHQYSNSNNNNSNSNRYSSPQKHTPEKIHFKPIQSKRKVVTDRNVERQNFIGKDTPIKGLENEEKVNLNAYGFGSTALKKNKSPSTQKLKIVSNIRKKN